MASDENVAGVVAAILSGLARSIDPASPTCQTNGQSAIRPLPGPDSISKSTLEHEISSLATRIQALEAQASIAGRANLPATPDEPRSPPTFNVESRQELARTKSSHSRIKSGARELQTTWVNNLLSSHTNLQGSDGTDQGAQNGHHFTDEEFRRLADHVKLQEDEIRRNNKLIADVKGTLDQNKEDQDRIKQQGINEIDALRRELVKHQQTNAAFSKALREIGSIVVAVADGDLSKKVLIHTKELDPEITTFKHSINKMVDQLQGFASEVTRLARDVGTEGMLDRQVHLPGVSGIWAELTDNVNIMAANLTDQVREIASVTTAVAHGDLSRKIERQAKGEILQLQQTINVMVDQLRTFATEVSRVAKNVGTEGVLGEQAQIEGVQGMWNDLTINVNAMANNLTNQVRDIAKVTTAVAKGDLTQKVTAVCKGEILELKLTINSMVDQLKHFSEEVTQLALDVGTEGRLGGQATVPGVEGTWRDLNKNVNEMAEKLVSVASLCSWDHR